ncbi:unnamed protein product [Lampetra fluviatilis]
MIAVNESVVKPVARRPPAPFACLTSGATVSLGQAAWKGSPLEPNGSPSGPCQHRQVARSLSGGQHEPQLPFGAVGGWARGICTVLSREKALVDWQLTMFNLKAFCLDYWHFFCPQPKGGTYKSVEGETGASVGVDRQASAHGPSVPGAPAPQAHHAPPPHPHQRSGQAEGPAGPERHPPQLRSSPPSFHHPSAAASSRRLRLQHGCSVNSSSASSSSASASSAFAKKHVEEEAIKRSRSLSGTYELSADLQDKQVEMLERKYGGHFLTSRAASTIQSAFRQYQMNKNFERLRCCLSESRLPRRLALASMRSQLSLEGADAGTGAARSSFGEGEPASASKGSPPGRTRHGGEPAPRDGGGVGASSEPPPRLPPTDSRDDNDAAAAAGGMHGGFGLASALGMDLSALSALSAPDDFADTITELEDAFSRQVKSLAESIDDALQSTQAEGDEPIAAPPEGGPDSTPAPSVVAAAADANEAAASVGNTVVTVVVTDQHGGQLRQQQQQARDARKQTHEGGTRANGGARRAEPCDLVRCSSESREGPSAARLGVGRGQQRRVSCPECGGAGGPPAAGPGCARLPLLTVEPASDSSLDAGSERAERVGLKRQDARDDQEGSPTHGGAARSQQQQRQQRQQQQQHRQAAADDVAPIVIVKRRTGRHTDGGHLGVNGGGAVKPTAAPCAPSSSAAAGNAAGNTGTHRRASRSESDFSDGEDGENESVNSVNSNSNETANCSSGSSSRDSLRGEAAAAAAALSRPSYHRETRHSWDSPAFSNDTLRKRHYRIGLNLFNKKPERGIQFLIERGFVPDMPVGVAHFLLQRKGLSRQMIGEYLGNRQKQFNHDVLDCVVDEMDFSAMELDEALRKFQAHIRVQGEAQKVERLIEAFSQRYCLCNPDVVQQYHNPDTIFILAFAIILLNTDMYSPNVKPERKMRLDDFVKNLRGVDDGADIPREILVGIYERIQKQELRTNDDHVTQVTKVEKSIVGKKPALSLPHRRLVCYCRLFEVPDPTKPQKLGLHQREIFLFNDLLVVTKIFQRKKNAVMYSFRQSFSLYGMQVHLFENQFYPHGIKIMSAVPGAETKVLALFNAPNPQDRKKFVDDLKESIAEVQEMEKHRIETELEKQKGVVRGGGQAQGRSGSKKESGARCRARGASNNGALVGRASMDDGYGYAAGEGLKRSTLSSSLRDLSDVGKRGRRGSAGSLDSNIEGSMLGSPHMARRAYSGSEGSASILGSLFSGKRAKTPYHGPPPSQAQLSTLPQPAVQQQQQQHLCHHHQHAHAHHHRHHHHHPPPPPPPPQQQQHHHHHHPHHHAHHHAHHQQLQLQHALHHHHGRHHAMHVHAAHAVHPALPQPQPQPPPLPVAPKPKASSSSISTTV